MLENLNSCLGNHLWFEFQCGILLCFQRFIPTWCHKIIKITLKLARNCDKKAMNKQNVTLKGTFKTYSEVIWLSYGWSKRSGTQNLNFKALNVKFIFLKQSFELKFVLKLVIRIWFEIWFEELLDQKNWFEIWIVLKFRPKIWFELWFDWNLNQQIWFELWFDDKFVLWTGLPDNITYRTVATLLHVLHILWVGCHDLLCFHFNMLFRIFIFNNYSHSYVSKLYMVRI